MTLLELLSLLCVIAMLFVAVVWLLECIAIVLFFALHIPFLIVALPALELTRKKHWRSFLREVIMSQGTRIALGAAVLGGSAIIVWSAFKMDESQTIGGFLLNAGTELGGIGVTILAIDRILAIAERRRNAFAIAQPSLRDLRRVVWVWLGGEKTFDLGRDCALLGEVEDDGYTIAHDTRRMLTELGSKAEHTLHVQTEVMQQFPKLRVAFEEIKTLFTSDDHTPSQVAAVLRAGIEGYAHTLGHRIAAPAQLHNAAPGTDVQLERYSSLRG